MKIFYTSLLDAECDRMMSRGVDHTWQNVVNGCEECMANEQIGVPVHHFPQESTHRGAFRPLF